MNLVVVGTNHKRAPVEIREKLAFFKKELKGALYCLSEYEAIEAAVILSTCNRIELYVDTRQAHRAIGSLKEFLCAFKGQELARIEPYLYTYIGKQALFHLASVASGLDSQIIGEPQIQEQVEFAYQQAKAIEATNIALDMFFSQALSIATKVRRQTQISQHSASLASIVFDLLKQKSGPLKDKKILLIGVGKIQELLAQQLKDEEARAVFIANRTYEKALWLASHIQAEAVRFDKLPEKLPQADIIISATASPHLILRKEQLNQIAKPLLIIDLAVPRDVDPQIKSIKGVTLICLDELEPVTKGIPAAAQVIKKEVEGIWLNKRLEWERVPAHSP